MVLEIWKSCRKWKSHFTDTSVETVLLFSCCFIYLLIFLIPIHNNSYEVIQKFIKILQETIDSRGVLTPPFYEDPPYIAYPLFFQILSNSPPLPCCLQPPTLILFLLSCFFGWMDEVYTCRTLKCVLCSKASSLEVWHIMWFFLVLYPDLILHTRRQTVHSGASRLTYI